MKEPLESPRELGEGYKYVSLGLTFAGGIILFMGMGFLLDRWLGWMPVLTVAGTLLGAVLSFLNVYWKLQADEKEYDAEHAAEHEAARRRNRSGTR
jgi:F0F1-type ATP synthase assembly protein I